MALQIENEFCHLWSDALHARALAHQARNDWDRGTYVRWTVTSAWTVLEACFCQALGIKKFELDFRRSVNEELSKLGCAPLDWGKGIWQRTRELQKWRKDYTHMLCKWSDLFPTVSRADEAITRSREAIKQIHRYLHKTPPAWIDYDEDRGWDRPQSGVFAFGEGIAIEGGVTEDSPDAVRIAYHDEEGEHVTRICVPGTDPEPFLMKLLRMKKPISEVRAYVGATLLCRCPVRMRGGPPVS